MAFEHKLFLPNDEGLRAAAEALRQGSPIVAPTETSYMLACDASQPRACEQVYGLKGRDATKPLPVIVGSMEIAQKHVIVNETAHRLGEAFWPGPLTMVLPKQPGILPEFYPETPTIALRVTSHDWVRRLALEIGAPIVSTSANISGSASCFSIAELRQQAPLLMERVGCIINAGTLQSMPPSTIITVGEGTFNVLRQGPILSAEIAQALR